jgi:hypothetical protein
MNFRIGQKVACINASNNNRLVLGAVYTITGIDTGKLRDMENGGRALGLFLAEVQHGRTDIPFYAIRFRPLVERKTDISDLIKLTKVREMEDV